MTARYGTYNRRGAHLHYVAAGEYAGTTRLVAVLVNADASAIQLQPVLLVKER